MSNNYPSHIAQSPEAVAYQLTQHVLAVEDKGGSPSKRTRQIILDTYAECLEATKDKRIVKPSH